MFIVTDAANIFFAPIGAKHIALLTELPNILCRGSINISLLTEGGQGELSQSLRLR